MYRSEYIPGISLRRPRHAMPTKQEWQPRERRSGQMDVVGITHLTRDGCGIPDRKKKRDLSANLHAFLRIADAGRAGRE